MDLREKGFVEEGCTKIIAYPSGYTRYENSTCLCKEYSWGVACTKPLDYIDGDNYDEIYLTMYDFPEDLYHSLLELQWDYPELDGFDIESVDKVAEELGLSIVYYYSDYPIYHQFATDDLNVLENEQKIVEFLKKVIEVWTKKIEEYKSELVKEVICSICGKKMYGYEMEPHMEEHASEQLSSLERAVNSGISFTLSEVEALFPVAVERKKNEVIKTLVKSYANLINKVIGEIKKNIGNRVTANESALAINIIKKHIDKVPKYLREAFIEEIFNTDARLFSDGARRIILKRLKGVVSEDTNSG